MSGGASWLLTLGLMCAVAGCGPRDDNPRSEEPEGEVPRYQQDASALGTEIFDLVDRAVAYRSSHQGRPAANLKQMGIESLTPATVRRMVNLQREPVITVAYRRPEQREIVSCRGDSEVLVEASLKGGRFTLMCTSRSGVQRPMEVGETPER
jgi:hypothetical protein